MNSNDKGLKAFIPNETIYPPGTNANHVFDQFLSDPDAPWFTQGEDSLQTMTMCARGSFELSRLPEDFQNTISPVRDTVLGVARSVSSACKKEFDVKIRVNTPKSTTVYIDVPKTVKKGFFRSETIIEKEERTEIAIVPEELFFRGWLLEHFERRETYSNEYLAWYH